MVGPVYLHLPSQVLVLVSDDRQGRLLTQGVGPVSKGLLWSWRWGRTPNFLVAQTVTTLVRACHGQKSKMNNVNKTHKQTH